jgi:hypothetical protein
MWVRRDNSDFAVRQKIASSLLGRVPFPCVHRCTESIISSLILGDQSKLSNLLPNLLYRARAAEEASGTLGSAAELDSSMRSSMSMSDQSLPSFVSSLWEVKNGPLGMRSSARR